MPTWGLTASQISAQPWGIPARFLAPAKTITDPVHGDIHLNHLECLLMDSPPMQRLRGVLQLGMAHEVYPSATHTRFTHSLGTLRGVQDLLDAIWTSHTNPQSAEFPSNLLEEWLDEDGRDGNVLSAEFARATVLARLGGLLHDLCHVPMGHTIEDDLRVLTSHDHNAKRFSKLWSQLNAEARAAIEQNPDLMAELRILIVSKDDHAKDFQHKSAYPFVGDIVGNTICADLTDYLRRDHHNSGLPLALGRRFMDSFFVSSKAHPLFPSKMVISVERDGRLRNDVVTELVKFLRYRYELTERVLYHHAKTAADAMLGKMLGLWSEHLWIEFAIQDNPTVFGRGTRSDRRQLSDARQDLEGSGPNGRHRAVLVDKKLEGRLEEEFLRRSDTGLLEYLRDLPAGRSRRLQHVKRLAVRLLNRQLYKEMGTAASNADRAIAHEVFQHFNSPAERHALERAAARYVGLDPDSDVCIWMPDPGMRLKVAQVLVHRDGMIAPLSEVDSRSRDLVQQHRELWGAAVYAPTFVRDHEDGKIAEALLAFVGEATGLAFRLPNGRRVPGTRQLAAESVLRKANPILATPQEVIALQVAAMTTDQAPTFASLVDSYEVAATRAGLIPNATHE